jgi:uncharacterized protein (DUF4415 family)
MSKTKHRKPSLADMVAKEGKSFTITQEEYEQDLREGADPEYALKPGVHKAIRGGLSKLHSEAEIKEAVKPENTKVRITMYVDLDILNFFKAAAAKENAAPYQTQINNSLREFIKGQNNQREVLLKDEEFLAALAQKVARYLPKAKAPKQSRARRAA